ncbi:MAG: hypothetical protein OXC40_04950, partial [Proteobacteria bacterium]|nr:hypothetical protein [Pseudomonadota bacterium]
VLVLVCEQGKDGSQTRRFSMAEGGYKAAWRFHRGKFQEQEYHLGATVDIGTRYGLQFLKETMEIHTARLDGYELDTVIGKEGKRYHDTIMFFAGLSPWFEWYKTQKYTIGIDGFLRGFYRWSVADSPNQAVFPRQMRASGYMEYLISPTVLVRWRIQADHWQALSYGSPSKFGTAIDVVTQFDPMFTLRLSGLASRYLTEKKSFFAPTTYVGSMILDTAVTNNFFLTFGTEVERYQNYQIWASSEDEPYQAHGTNLGLLGGLKFRPFHYFDIIFGYRKSRNLWNTSITDNLTKTEWQKYAPVIQNRLFVKLDWNIHF